MSNLVKRKVQRIFISSTFVDMHQERDFLINLVEPQINAQLVDMNVRVDFCDFRWGIDTSGMTSSVSESVFDTCFNAIESCQSIFIGIIGNRYGWVNKDASVQNLIQHKLGLDVPVERSITEYEIRYALKLREKRELKTLFLFRETERSERSNDCDSEEYLDEDRVNSLKKLIETNVAQADILRYRAKYQKNSHQSYEILDEIKIANYIVAKIVQFIKDENTKLESSSSIQYEKSPNATYQIRKLQRDLNGVVGGHFVIECLSRRNGTEVLSLFANKLLSKNGRYLISMNGGVDGQAFSILTFIKYCISFCDGYQKKTYNQFRRSVADDNEKLEVTGAKSSFVFEVKNALRELKSKLSNSTLIILIDGLDLFSLSNLKKLTVALKGENIGFAVLATGLKERLSSKQAEIKELVRIFYGEDFIINYIRDSIITNFLENKLKSLNRKVLEDIKNSELSRDIEWLELALNRISNLTCDDYNNIHKLKGDNSRNVALYQRRLIKKELSNTASEAMILLLAKFIRKQKDSGLEMISSLFDVLLSHPTSVDITQFKRFLISYEASSSAYLIDVFIEKFSVSLYTDISGLYKIKSVYVEAYMNIKDEYLSQYNKTARERTFNYVMSLKNNSYDYNLMAVSVALSHLDSRLFNHLDKSNYALLEVDIEDALLGYFRNVSALLDNVDDQINALSNWINEALDHEFIPIFYALAKKNVQDDKGCPGVWSILLANTEPLISEKLLEMHKKTWWSYFHYLSRLQAQFTKGI